MEFQSLCVSAQSTVFYSSLRPNNNFNELYKSLLVYINICVPTCLILPLRVRRYASIFSLPMLCHYVCYIYVNIPKNTWKPFIYYGCSLKSVENTKEIQVKYQHLRIFWQAHYSHTHTQMYTAKYRHIYYVPVLLNW